MLNIAQIIPVTQAEGPGKRFALWFQGCPLRCPGCCNPEMLSFEGGRPVLTEFLLQQIDAAKEGSGIEGITLLGGEPFAHASGAAELAGQVQAAGLSVMIFSGYTLEEIRAINEPAAAKLLEYTDLLVDGPYLRDQPETRRRWIGSANQRIHFLSDRYRADDPCWQVANTLEIRLTSGELSVNGFPAKQAKEFWQRLPREGLRNVDLKGS